MKKPLPKNDRTDNFPIVGIGASAGGLEAYTQLLKELPSDTGMAFVVIQHLDPTHSSFLKEALVKTTSMTVLEIVDGQEVKPDHVYVIPPGFDLTISQMRLYLSPREEASGRPHLPIDSFFRSLALHLEGRAIGVVLSGNASDGTEGLRAIQNQGGITFSQDPVTAKFSGMPESALKAGVVDFSLSIPNLARELVRTGKSKYYLREIAEPFAANPEQAEFDEILELIRLGVGVDFREYKPTTTQRRLARRLALLRMDSLKDYLVLKKKKSK